MPRFDITSTSNPRIKRLVGLRDRGPRDEEGVFVVEGPRQLERAIAAGLDPLEVYLDGTYPYSGPGQVATVDPETLARASYRSRSQGVLAVLPQFAVDLDPIPIASHPLVLVAEAIEKPGNLGAMLRTSDATRADLFVAVGAGVDPFNPNVVRASQGALFTVPLAVTDLDGLGAWLGEHEIDAVAADPSSRTPYWELDLTGRVAIVVGAEADGLSDGARQLARKTASIPMGGAGDSLNASVSLALFAYEALRQRR